VRHLLLLISLLALGGCNDVYIGCAIGYLQSKGVTSPSVSMTHVACPDQNQRAVAWATPPNRGGVLCVSISDGHVTELFP